MDGNNRMLEQEPERYYDWMLWKMRQERKKMEVNKQERSI